MINLKPLVKKILLLLISFNLIMTQTMSAATGIGASERTAEISIDMIKSGAPSDLPIAGVGDYFEKEHFSFVENFDISAYANKQIFVGFGIFDQDQENCKFLEIPGLSKIDFDTTFSKYGKFNQHSYGVVASSMNFNDCKATAEGFGGHPVMIDDVGENTFVSTKFVPSSTERVWIGMKAEPNCYDYKTELSRNQEFFSWKSDAISSSLCGGSVGVVGPQKRAAVDSNRKWTKLTGGGFNICVVEWDTDDYARPIKVCAPWWKIVREFKNKAPGLYDTNNLKRINQADIPKQYNICTQYQASVTTAPTDTDNSRVVNCTSFYDMTRKPECVRDILQPQCFEDQCGGYIKNVCTHVDESQVGKGYIKGEKIIAGQMQSVKVKDRVTLHVYNCPAPHVSADKCLVKGLVTFYPKECPGSNCVGLRDCLLSSTTSSQADIDACYAGNTCEKKFPSRDYPPLIVAGELTEMYGVCDDGSLLTFLPNLNERNGKTCTEYDTVEITQSYTELCKSDRPFIEVSVDTALDEEDEYQVDENCVRMDTASESQEDTLTAFNVDLNGYFLNRITKVNYDGVNETFYSGGSEDFILSGAVDSVGAGMVENADPSSGVDTTEVTVINNTTPLVDCTPYDPSGAASAWYTKNEKIFLESGALDANIYSSGEVKTAGVMKVQIKDTFLISSDVKCGNYGSNHGFGSYVTSHAWSQTLAGENTCILTLSQTGPDTLMDSIKMFSGTEVQYDYTGTKSGKNCRDSAICLSGKYNEAAYSSPTSTAPCIVVVDGSGSPSAYMDEVRAENGMPPHAPAGGGAITDDMCQPIASQENAGNDINLDSLESIVVIEDYLTGGFGYYSNYNQWFAKANQVHVSFDSESNKYAFPFFEISKITDNVTYFGQIFHTSYLSKEAEPEKAVGAAVGAAAMTAIMTVLLCSGPIGWIIAVVAVIVFAVIMLLGPSKKMDSQYVVWIVYKYVPKAEYIKGVYEKRSIITNQNVLDYGFDVGWKNAGRAPVFTNTPEYKLLYHSMYYYSGRVEPDDYNDYISDYLQKKKASLSCGGFAASERAKAVHQAETGVMWSYPECEWYKPYCQKDDTQNEIRVTETLAKEMTNVYVGAVNTLVILVPFAGAYKVEAFDKYDELLAENTLSSNSFVQAGGTDRLKFAKVTFGLLMQPATGMRSDATTIVPANLRDGQTTGACLADPMVEWGGGVSGVYYEAKTTGFSSGSCFKSDDDYVRDRSMTKIVITPTNMDHGFEYELIKPMPYPNRVYIASMDKLAKRVYRCYEDFPNCAEDEFHAGEE